MSQAKPRLTLLSAEQIHQVHEYSLEILATTGVRVDSPRARAVFERASGRAAGNDRVRIPRETVAWALSVAPARVTLYDRRGAPAFTLDAAGQDGVRFGGARFGIGVTNLYYQEPETDAVVLFTREHMARCTRLGDALPGFDVISTLGVLHDVPPERSDLVAVLEMIANATKPLVVLVSREEAFEPVLDLLEALGGDLAARPFVIPYVNPVTPLVINAGTSDKMFSAIGRGLPVIYSNYGMAGATAPITPAGTLAVLNAELLAGLVLAQLIRAGTPVILGSLPASFDMRLMTSYYGAETMLLNLACGEMMAHYGVPHCGTSGSGGGWGADLLAADGFWLNHLTTCVGTVGLAPFVGGNFDSLVFSPAAAVYADQIIYQARRFADGFTLDPAAVGLAEINQVEPGGNFLTAGMTLRHFRQADYRSPIFPRLSLEAWQAQGCPNAGDLLRERTVDLLAHARPPADYPELMVRGEALIRAWTAG
jgi:trimethylamine---corrinoid protein Co-methyltransferase